MATDLQKCCSEEQFLLSFIPFLVLLCSFSKVQISPKVMIAYNASCYGFCLLRHTKAWLARDIISGTMFSRALYYIVNFESSCVFQIAFVPSTRSQRKSVNKYNPTCKKEIRLDGTSVSVIFLVKQNF